MPSTRFTVHVREAVVSKITDYSFEKIEAEHRQKSYDLAEKLYNFWVSPAQLKKMQELPASFFRSINSAFWVVTARGYNTTLEFDGEKNYIPTDFSSVRVSKWPELNAEIEDLAVAVKTRKEERASFSRKTDSYIRQFTTIEKFMEASPDLYKICKDVIAKRVGHSVTTAVTPVANEILCSIAKNRNEFRTGCV